MSDRSFGATVAQILVNLNEGHAIEPASHLHQDLQRTFGQYTDLIWLLQNERRYHAINAKRDAGRSVASFEKEFIATYDRRKHQVEIYELAPN